MKESIVTRTLFRSLLRFTSWIARIDVVVIVGSSHILLGVNVTVVVNRGYTEVIDISVYHKGDSRHLSRRRWLITRSSRVVIVILILLVVHIMTSIALVIAIDTYVMPS